MSTFSAQMRAAAVDLLTDYVASVAGLKVQIYRARPATIVPPTAFVDGFSEAIDNRGIAIVQRHPSVDVMVLHGIFDHGETVDQRDAFVDGFLGWVRDNVHAASGNTTVGMVGVEDIPAYVPDWIRPDAQGRLPTYYATRITLEGLEPNA
jgi:hypothetical protein